jgi:hypothetical protein
MEAVQGTVTGFAAYLARKILSWRRRGFRIGGLGSRERRR